jgi:hypothetical protein
VDLIEESLALNSEELELQREEQQLQLLNQNKIQGLVPIQGVDDATTTNYS